MAEGESGRLTLECCAECVPLAELVGRLLLEVSVMRLVLQGEGLMKERRDA